jgi:ATP-binding cassette subfamily B protein
MADHRRRMTHDPLFKQSRLRSQASQLLWQWLWPLRMAWIGAAAAMLAVAGATIGIGHSLKTMVNSNDIGVIHESLLLLLLASMVMAFASFSRIYLMGRAGERLAVGLRQQLLQAFFASHAQHRNSSNMGDWLSRLSSDVAEVQQGCSQNLPFALRHVLVLLVSGTMLVRTSSQLTLLVLVLLPLLLLPLSLIGRPLKRLGRQAQDHLGQMHGLAEESLFALPMLQAYDCTAVILQRFAGMQQQRRQLVTRVVGYRAFLVLTVMMLIAALIVGVLWFGTTQVFAQHLSQGELTAFVFYALMLAGATAGLGECYSDFGRMSGSIERIGDILETSAPTAGLIAHPSVASDVALPPIVATRPPSIRFAGVGFCYPNRPDHPALSDLNFTVPAGSSLTIIGQSGAGKSTLAMVLLGFYPPTTGQICFDAGGDSAALCFNESNADRLLPWLRRLITWLPQEPPILSGSVRDNLLLVAPNASQAELEEAANAAGLDFIAQLPDGFDSPLGPKGIQLSVGQRQRLAIARAVLRQSPILLLDEPGSALDSVHDAAVQLALKTLLPGRTLITISHSMKHAATADQVLVLADGHQVGLGTPAALAADNRFYQQFLR